MFGWKAHINKWKIDLYILTITDVFLNQKRINVPSNSSGVRVGHGWATAQGAGYKGEPAH